MAPAFRDSPDNFNVSVWDRKEVEANRFAAEILMPKDAVGYLINTKKIIPRGIWRLPSMFLL
jgi:hypothetical protein